MEVVSCPALIRANHRTLTLPRSQTENDSFTFGIIADPQLGLLERYVEKRPLPHQWNRELECLDRSINLLNRLSPKPDFVMVCGDLVDAPVGGDYREPQTSDLLNAFSALDPEMALLTLPGNHDVGDSPTKDTIQHYTQTWGDDYYSFQTKGIRFLVLNSQYLWDNSNCISSSKEFHGWLESQLIQLEDTPNISPVVFQHIPFFEREPNEPDDYFNIPTKLRSSLLFRMYAAGIRYVFTGHLHRNSVLTWSPPVDGSGRDKTDPLHLISTSSVCIPLGSDPPGIRLVHVNTNRQIKHNYWNLDELEALLNKGGQPNFV